MRQQTVRSIRRHAAVYAGLALTGMVIGWNQARTRQPRVEFPLRPGGATR
jgi:hypothetical protein